MSLLTFVRKNPDDAVNVREEIGVINRLLERAFPDCTCCVLGVGNFGTASQWVTVELEITRESLDCVSWYTRQATDRNLALSAWKPRQVPTFEADIAGDLVAVQY